ncbi:MAG: UDP-N-acetylmuramate:L-alanyl-gamma-D-glutamyl-meso-diaminopimelate ligase [Gammaproteobacteria bacterium]|nr:UDP-N-acetylmuramate:L-alanyl-gamma-D-glutamyl-meso-diaminopimelate ligase [Gammaproteobacteria bacterium]
MHVHILGICGTFMGGIACLAREAGHVVSGSDANVYPPMSTQLQALGIELLDLTDLTQFERNIDIVIVGNAMTRGMPAIEHLLNSKLPYTSGPQWLAENILQSRHVLAVAGTHGKTTTASMLAWILESAGLSPGFLIGGVPADFEVSARSGDGRYFVVEADEYDTAFFDKRSKFVHYHPDTLILNNLEFDHADIFDNLDQIERQFHHLVRTVPGNGCIFVNATDNNLERVMAMGCWSQTQSFALDQRASDWTIVNGNIHTPSQARLAWSPPMPGDHNASNSLAAIAAASHVGVDCEKALDSMARFGGVARRLQLYAEVGGVRIYDDFAHHPTAISATLDGVRQQVGDARVIAVIEPRSNTMKRDIHTALLAESLRKADAVWLYDDKTLAWDPRVVVGDITNGHVVQTIDSLIDELAAELAAGDQVVIMSNGGFGGVHARLAERLAQ